MIVRIWIKPLRYGNRGLVYRTTLGSLDGLVLCARTILPSTDSCRALLKLGIIGQFETWREGVTYACMTGDIEKTAELTVIENRTCSPRFAKWEGYPPPRDALSRDRERARTRETDEAGKGVAGTFSLFSE
jgi:hypothetical protein